MTVTRAFIGFPSVDERRLDGRGRRHDAEAAGDLARLAGFADAREYASALLEATGVAVTPGGDFDPVEGSHCVRLSLAAGPEAIADALDRIIAWQDSRRSTGARG